MTTSTTPVSLNATHEAMMQLIIPGKQPNGKLAFWNACLSTRNSLERNCKQALVMRQYVNRPLPVNRDVLRAELGGLLERTLNSLYEIERLWNAGIIHFNAGDTFDEQCIWRRSMAATIPGMAEKTVSFALHIYAPLQCKILTIDCWHGRRLDYRYGDISSANYLAYEWALYQDIQVLAIAEGQGYLPIVYAACLWERERQKAGKSKSKNGEYQSHADLSCYV